MRKNLDIYIHFHKGKIMRHIRAISIRYRFLGIFEAPLMQVIALLGEEAHVGEIRQRLSVKLSSKAVNLGRSLTVAPIFSMVNLSHSDFKPSTCRAVF